MLSLSSNVASDDLGLPFSNNGIPDIVEEVKWELDWLENMQDPDDGGVFPLSNQQELLAMKQICLRLWENSGTLCSHTASLPELRRQIGSKSWGGK